jgi:hypothetical protein
MIAQPQPLIEVFAEIPDFRRCRGKRHPLPAILSLACGARSRGTGIGSVSPGATQRFREETSKGFGLVRASLHRFGRREGHLGRRGSSLLPCSPHEQAEPKPGEPLQRIAQWVVSHVVPLPQ